MKIPISFCMSLASLICLSIVAGAQQAGPSKPSQAYVVMSQQALAETVKALRASNDTKNLIAGENIGCRVFVQHEKDVSTNQAEVHDGADDVFIIMEGTATLTLGGALESPTQIQPGEWRAPRITGGREFKVNGGDVVMVPRGTPHVRSTIGEEVTVMIVKSLAPPGRR